MNSHEVYKDSRIKDAWRLFISKGIVRREILRNEIAYSWVRSRLHGIELEKIPADSKITSEVLRQFQKRDEGLVNVLTTFLNNLPTLRTFEDVQLGIANKDGLVLKTFNEVAFESQLLAEGRRMSEEAIGTNAIGTALKSSKDLIVYGAEHYSKPFQKYITYGSLIYDSEGESLGLLVAVSKFRDDSHVILDKLREVADIAAKELTVHVDNRKLLTINDHLDNIIDSIPDALLCVDQFGEILDFNSKAEITFLEPMSQTRLKGSNIRNVIEMDDSMYMEQMLNGKQSNKRWEGYYKRAKIKRPCTLEVISMKHTQEKRMGNILIRILDQKEQYHQFNQMMGQKARYKLDDIVGESHAINEIKRVALQHSNTVAPVLMLGEPGTGKKILAQSIHNAGNRQLEPFYHLDCKSIPKKQIESELFGHIEAYNSNEAYCSGLLEMANKGTLYVSNIEEMPLQTQLKLLKYIEEKRFYKLGSSVGRTVDVRLLFGTKVDLEIQVNRGTFRSDLYNRISMMQINMTPLRERKEDIPKLIDYLVDEIGFTQNKHVKDIEVCFYERMMTYYWPNNAREMHNVLQYIFYRIKDEAVLVADMIPEQLFEGIEDAHLRTTTLRIDDIEKEAIMKAIEITDENLSQAAKLLGIGRSTLYRKMDKYKIKLYHNETLYDVKMGSASK